MAGGVRVPDRGHRSAGTLASGYGDRIDHLLITVPADVGSADVDLMCYGGCGPSALVLQAEEEGSVK
eukprot:3502279-Prymnesium_polylepis.1